jgi:hypothetical protein
VPGVTIALTLPVIRRFGWGARHDEERASSLARS